MDFGVQRSRSQCSDNCEWFMLHNCFQFTPIIMKHHTKTPHELRMCLWVLGSKGQGHNALITENGLCRIIAFNLHLSSETSYKDSPWVEDVLMGSGFHRSCIDYWKWFLAHNCFPFTSAFIKLHSQIPCESRICPNDIEIKRMESLNLLPGGGGGGLILVAYWFGPKGLLLYRYDVYISLCKQNYWICRNHHVCYRHYS